jgi:hypothetical protein
MSAVVVTWLVVVLQVGGAVMVAYAILPSREGESLTPWWSWGRAAIPVRFNRGLFRFGLLAIALGSVVEALNALGSVKALK